jgi:hypothetical protein
MIIDMVYCEKCNHYRMEDLLCVSCEGALLDEKPRGKTRLEKTPSKKDSIKKAVL